MSKPLKYPLNNLSGDKQKETLVSAYPQNACRSYANLHSQADLIEFYISGLKCISEYIQGSKNGTLLIVFPWRFQTTRTTILSDLLDLSFLAGT